MEMVIKIPGENEMLFEALKDFSPSLLKDRIEINLGSDVEDKIFKILSEVEFTVVMFLYEFGGGKTNTGSGSVVCGLKGEMLEPKEIFRDGHLANRIHAKFETNHGYIVNSTKNGKISITEGKIVMDPCSKHYAIFKMETTDIWSGPLKELPRKLNMFEKAAMVAKQKANCYHCRHVHFALRMLS